MEKYRVINSFKDLEDNNNIYIKDKDIYPREGLEPTKKRIKELTSTKNKIGKVLIEEIKTEETNISEENEETSTETEETKASEEKEETQASE